ncbi:MAG: methyltransferase domain-containing protein [Planctomycetes bacterium]|nr:methyltransferase domain-containing protein [Planctomycetota bacterium]
MSLKLLKPDQIKSYFSSPNTISTWWDPLGGRFRYHFENILCTLQKFQLPLKNSQVLDVGTGRGLFAVWFAHQGCKVHAVDISPEMLELAREKAKEANIEKMITFQLGDAEELQNIPDSSFDLVSCMSTFDHIPDLDKAIAAMSRKLKDQGYFLFTYCPCSSLHGRLYQLYAKYISKIFKLSDDKGLVAKLYQHKEIEDVMARNNICIERRLGVGLLCLLLRPQFEKNALFAIPRCVSKIEERIFPFYKSKILVNRSQTIIGLGRKKIHKEFRKSTD